MREVSNLKVTQIRIYRADELPFSRLRSKEIASALQDRFSFGPMQEAIAIAQGPIPAFGFEHGILSLDPDEVPVAVTRLMFDPRRIILTVEGGSEQADRAVQEMESVIAAAKGGVDLSGTKPELLYQETACDVTLDVGFQAVWSVGMAGFLETEMFHALSLEDAKAIMGTPTLQIQVLYQITNSDLVASQIMLNPATVTIAAKAGVPLKARRFTVSSPTDSKTHLKIIEHLEASLVGRKR
jgi:hypothetical protein